MGLCYEVYTRSPFVTSGRANPLVLLDMKANFASENHDSLIILHFIWSYMLIVSFGLLLS